MTSGGVGGADRAELGNRDLELREQLEQVALELLVGAVDLVDQQHRRPRPRRVDGLQQRPLDRGTPRCTARAGRASRSSVAGGFEDAQLEQLPRVVPLVDRVRDVEPLVALQPDQIGVERPRRRRGERRLADAGLALEKQRPPEPQRQEQRHREAAVGDVLLARQGAAAGPETRS